MKPIIKIICFSIVVAITLPTLLQADSIDPIPPSPKIAVLLTIDEQSAIMGISAAGIKRMIKQESGYSQEAVGDHGAARGVAQYHKPTFDFYESKYFKVTGKHLNYTSAHDQIVLMAWQFKFYPKSRFEWSTYSRFYSTIYT